MFSPSQVYFEGISPPLLNAGLLIFIISIQGIMKKELPELAECYEIVW